MFEKLLKDFHMVVSYILTIFVSSLISSGRFSKQITDEYTIHLTFNKEKSEKIKEFFMSQFFGVCVLNTKR